jgi:hypothetical protein
MDGEEKSCDEMSKRLIVFYSASTRRMRRECGTLSVVQNTIIGYEICSIKFDCLLIVNRLILAIFHEF